MTSVCDLIQKLASKPNDCQIFLLNLFLFGFFCVLVWLIIATIPLGAKDFCKLLIFLKFLLKHDLEPDQPHFRPQVQTILLINLNYYLFKTSKVNFVLQIYDEYQTISQLKIHIYFATS